MPITQDDNLTRLLTQKKILSRDAIAAFQQQALQNKQTLFQYLLQYQLLDSEKLAQHGASFFQLPLIKLENQHHHALSINEIPIAILKNKLILPVLKKENQLTIAISDPNDIDFAKTLSFQLGINIHIGFARYDIACRLHNALVSEHSYQQSTKKNESVAQSVAHQILSDAIHRGASDIHFEPYQYHLRVRFRIDGLLHEIIRMENQLTDAITSCLKVLAHLDISIKRLPQDGRLTFYTNLGFFKDCRVNTCPTQHGEKMVVRLLDANTKMRSIGELGLKAADQKIILKTLSKPQGLILVTGPTGSGKTITLYTLLNLLNESHRNISTIEDPIEIQIDGINQIPVNTKSGLTFSHALRALLRQDPDVMMIGEIRDTETAEMAIRAAQTGHLVLSTLHTNSAPEAITRLCHMGITPFHLGSALTLIIAQRLIRRLCPHCKNRGENHCIHCSSGFIGRLGVFELLLMHPEIKQLIFDHRPHTDIATKNRELGNMNLWESGMLCVQEGITSLSELYRAIPE